MANYKSRYEYTIGTTNRSQQREDHWLTELEHKLTKEAVQPKRVDDSLYSQINNIINGNSKYKSVDDAVKDMQKRSGFLDYINKMADQAADLQTKDGSHSKSTPKLFADRPEVKEWLKNNITVSGLVEPSVLRDLQSRFHNIDSREWEDPELIKYITKLIEKANKARPTEENVSGIGSRQYDEADVDPANNDAWDGLMPATRGQ